MFSNQVLEISLKAVPGGGLDRACLSNGIPINWMHGMRSWPFGISLGEHHKQRMVMRSKEPKIPFKTNDRSRLHSSILNLWMTNKYIIYPGSVCVPWQNIWWHPLLQFNAMRSWSLNNCWRMWLSACCEPCRRGSALPTYGGSYANIVFRSPINSK